MNLINYSLEFSIREICIRSEGSSDSEGRYRVQAPMHSNSGFQLHFRW